MYISYEYSVQDVIIIVGTYTYLYRYFSNIWEQKESTKWVTETQTDGQYLGISFCSSQLRFDFT